jgi:3-deoxy-7-phosphoheptulonate synthase
MRQTDDINVRGTVALIAPDTLKRRLPMTEAANATVVAGRAAVRDILQGVDKRLLVVVGPCSIHDDAAALEYARRLAKLNDELSSHLCLVMRVYFEKPRTTVGWKGLINDPHMDGTFDMEEGLTRARRLLLEVCEMGLPTATEMLDPITPQYLADLVVWASIGARTTESQTHRQMASGLSMPVGYKNGTDGNLQTALDAMESSRRPHAFLGIDSAGQTCVVHTLGNPLGHLILRGGQSGPNYGEEHVAGAVERLRAAELCPRIMVDCSHANSNKDFRLQTSVFEDVLEQRVHGNENVIGVMVESNLSEGSQKLPADLSQLRYGVSVTDGCIGWEETEHLLRSAAQGVSGLAAVAS